MAPAASPSNPYKRQIDAVQRVYDCAKRLKSAGESGDSATATASRPPAQVLKSVSEGAAKSETESDDDSWISESSEDPSDESDEDSSEAGEDDHEKDEQEDGGVVNLRANRGVKPDYKISGDEDLEDIRPFLKDFLPKLKAANEELEAQKRAGKLQTSELTGEGERDGEEHYIEMNLGLGVLEEKADDAELRPHDSSDQEDESDKEDQGREKDILGKLMGRDKLNEPIGIQEVTDMQGNT